MARGFESKDVEFQQAERERGRTTGRALTPDERHREEQRRRLELALSHLNAEHAAARHVNHRAMLERAIADLQQQLQALT